MKVAIVGTAPSSASAPYFEESWQVWGLSVAPLVRWDRWFEIHTWEEIERFPHFVSWLEGLDGGKPVYMQEASPRVPGSVPYPLAQMVAKYGTWFFTSTVAYMLALAIEEGAEEIGIWGVDMAANFEYRHQKQGCRFFLQTALMKGVRITAPFACEVLPPGRLYGFEPDISWLGHKAQAKKDEYEARLAALVSQRDAMILQKAALQGRLDITQPEDKIREMLAQIDKSLPVLDEHIKVHTGGIQAIEHVRTNWS